jgi:hypothetical protein
MTASDRLLPSLDLVQRVLSADAAYTISRMQVLERLPGNPIGIAYRWMDDTVVALAARFLPSFTRVIGLRSGHERHVEPLVRWYLRPISRPMSAPGSIRRAGHSI